MLKLDAKINTFFTTFDEMMTLQGEVYRQLENRCTQRITLGADTYFIKQHFGVGWKEIIKNICQLRWPVVSAKNEWQALTQLHHLRILAPRVVGYGCRGWNPATRQSFILTEALPTSISLEELGKNWQTQPPSFQLKQQLIKEVARIARVMHQQGMNHRDFYLCHFLLAQPFHLKRLKLFLIDLHRAQLRARVPVRWVIKDLAGLYFSSKDIGLTKRDKLRFMREYRNKSLDLILTQEAIFWQRVKKRGDKLYQSTIR